MIIRRIPNMNIKYIGSKTRSSNMKKFYRYKNNTIKEIKMYKVFRTPFDPNNISDGQIKEPDFEIPENIALRNQISFIAKTDSYKTVSISTLFFTYSKVLISWGDSVTQLINLDSTGYAGDITHTYSTANKNYLIKIYPSSEATTTTCQQPYIYLSTVSKIVYINSFGEDTFNLQSISISYISTLIRINEKALNNCKKLKSFSMTDTPIEQLPDSLFNTCIELQGVNLPYNQKLKSIPENLFADCDCLNLVSFNNCNSVISIPENLFKNKTSITNLNSCFGTFSVNSIPENLFKDCINLESVSDIFNSMTNLTTVPNNLFATCKKIQNASGAFKYCYALTKATKMFSSNYLTQFDSVYCGCSNLESVDEDIFSECPNITDISYFFMYTEKLLTIPVNLFRPLTKVTTMENVFQYGGLQQIPAGLFDTLTEVTNFSGCFASLPIVTVPAGLFNTCTKVETFYGTFSSTNLTSIPPNLFTNCRLVTSFTCTFSYAKLTSIPSIFNTTLNCNYNYCFQANTSLLSVSTELFANCTGNIRANNLFESCSSLTAISASFKNPGINEINSAFKNCINLTVVPSDIFNTCAITDCSNTFYNCASLNYAPQLWTYLSPVPAIHKLTFFGATSASNYSLIPYDWRALEQPPS